MAALISQALGIEPDQIVGDRGEFTVWLDDTLVGRKESADEDIVAAVSRALRSR